MENEAKVESADPKKSATKLWLIPGLIVLVVGALAAAIFLTPLGNQLWGENDGSQTAAVSPDRETQFVGEDGAPNISIPQGAIDGSGTLKVRQTELNGQSGWNISVENAQLVGEATVTFSGAVTEGSIAPLAAYSRGQDSALNFSAETEVSGTDLVVKTPVFADWFLVQWDEVQSWVDQNLIEQENTAVASDCASEVDETYSMTSTGPDLTQACLESSGDGAPLMTFVNRSNQVEVVTYPEVFTIESRTGSEENWFEVLTIIDALSVGPALHASNATFLGPMETLTLAVNPYYESFDLNVGRGVQSTAAQAEILALGLLNEIGNLLQLELTKLDWAEDLRQAQCTIGSADEPFDANESGTALASFLPTAFTLVSPCALEVFGSAAGDRVGPAINASVEQIFAQVPEQISANQEQLATQLYSPYQELKVANSAPVVELTEQSLNLNGAALTLDIPARWSTTETSFASSEGISFTDDQGLDAGVLSVLTVFGVSGPGEPPVNLNFRDFTQSENVVSNTGEFGADTIIYDARQLQFPNPSQPAGSPFVLRIGAEAAEQDHELMQVQPAGLNPILVVDALGGAPAGTPATRVVFLEQAKYFPTLADALAYLDTDEYQTIKDIILSLRA